MKKRIAILSVLAIICMLFVAPSSFAHTVSFVNNMTHSVNPITNYQVNGDNMVGMLVTANFTNGGSETIAWSATGPGAGAALGTGWSLSEAGDTYGGLWSLTNTGTATTALGITSLSIDAFPGRSVFDITDGPSTPGSANGWTFQVNATSISNIDATYMDMVAIGAAAPVGDIWRYLDVDFTNSQQGSFGANDNLTFIADTDNIVPEPGTMLLLGTGLLGLVGFRKKSE